MNKTFCVVCLSACGALGFAQTSPTAPAPKATGTPQPVHQPARPVKTKALPAGRILPVATIPADAVKTPEGAYRYKDPKGKIWLYRDTPFGISRVEETSRTTAAAAVQTPFGATKPGVAMPAAAPVTTPSPAATAQITAVAKGDVIYFQKPTPFGVTSWQKSKSNLTSEEQKVWEREQAKETH